jgi:hypothetical protein
LARQVKLDHVHPFAEDMIPPCAVFGQRICAGFVPRRDHFDNCNQIIGRQFVDVDGIHMNALINDLEAGFTPGLITQREQFRLHLLGDKAHHATV